MDIDRLPARRPSAKHRWTSPRRRWGAGRIALLLSLVLLIALSASVLHIYWSKRRSGEVATATPSPAASQAPSPPPPASPPAPEAPPQRLVEKPSARPAPTAVNAFLELEYERNAARCLELADKHRLAIEPAFSVNILEPQWDPRKAGREVVWFYVYQAATLQSRPYAVFGAVDADGTPLFQHPKTEHDPLALLESQYDGFQWVALDHPQIALIAAMVRPTRETGAVLDFFQVGISGTGTAGFWRFADQRSPEQPRRSDEMCAFIDVNGDGYRDLVSVYLETDAQGIPSRPRTSLRVFNASTGRYPQTSERVSEQHVETLLTLFGEEREGGASAEPVFWRSAMTPAPPEDVVSEGGA